MALSRARHGCSRAHRGSPYSHHSERIGSASRSGFMRSKDCPYRAFPEDSRSGLRRGRPAGNAHVGGSDLLPAIPAAPRPSGEAAGVPGTARRSDPTSHPRHLSHFISLQPRTDRDRTDTLFGLTRPGDVQAVLAHVRRHTDHGKWPGSVKPEAGCRAPRRAPEAPTATATAAPATRRCP